jgi:hypothetical protein
MTRCVIFVLAVLTIVGSVVGGVGCTSSSSEANRPEMVPRPPVPPDQVKFYRTPPAKFDVVGLVRVPVTPELRWNERGDATAGFQIMRSKAAAMGANGVLLKVPENEYDRQVTAGYKDDWYTISLRGQPGQATAVAQAIYVYERQ